jgi:hypothetical protein
MEWIGPNAMKIGLLFVILGVEFRGIAQTEHLT